MLILFPCAAFSFINPLVFLLPIESGDRIGYSTTILLSYTIFLSLVTAAIPATSNPMSIILIILTITIVTSGFIVVVAIVTIYLYNRDENTKMNSFWRFIGSRFPWCKNKTPVTPINCYKETEIDENIIDTSVTWKEVCNSLDILSMIVSYVLTVLFILLRVYT